MVPHGVSWFELKSMECLGRMASMYGMILGERIIDCIYDDNKYNIGIKAF